jgi:hypothetical protein
MLIRDLPYLENVPENGSIVGSAAALVNASASALGSSALALTRTNTNAIQLKNGGSIAFGFGTALARGVNPMASVTVAGSGNIVITSTINILKRNVDVASGFVVAIDLPA